jgi:hypothetical protein
MSRVTGSAAASKGVDCGWCDRVPVTSTSSSRRRFRAFAQIDPDREGRRSEVSVPPKIVWTNLRRGRGSLAQSRLVTVGPDHDPAELGAIAANTRVERTISHASVLAHGRLLVSHAGHGSVMKALWFGRPMVLVPWRRDQPGVAARALALGVAEVVPRETASPETLSVAIDRALSNEEMRATAAQHATRLRATDPPAIAASLVETLL